MTYLEHYPITLQIQFALIVMSVLLYIADVCLVIYCKAYNYFAFRLFLYLSISQLFTLLPQMLVPFITNPNGDPRNSNIIEGYTCYVQGTFINSGWISASLISNLMMYCVLEVLSGNIPRRDKYQEIKWVVGIYSFSFIPYLILIYFHQYEVFPWHLNGKPIYTFCQLIETNFSTWVIVSLLVVIFIGQMAYLQVRIFKRNRQLKLMGVEINHPIVHVHWLALVQLLFWTFNAFIKFLDFKFPILKQQDNTISFIWAFSNILYFFEAFVVSYIFIYFYLPSLKPNLSGKVYYLLLNLTYCLCFSKEKQIYLEESCNEESECTDDECSQTFLKTSSLQENGFK